MCVVAKLIIFLSADDDEMTDLGEAIMEDCDDEVTENSVNHCVTNRVSHQGITLNQLSPLFRSTPQKMLQRVEVFWTTLDLLSFEH